MSAKWKHRPCPCGCGELADECMRPGDPFQAFQIRGGAMSDRTSIDDLTESEAQIRAESYAEERANAIERETYTGLVHLRDLDRPHRAKCGAGYDWPSTIALRDDPEQVTCSSCKRVEEFFPEPDAEPPF